MKSILKTVGWFLVLSSMLLMYIAMDRSEAHADPKPGLWQESVTSADGVTIRKIRDTTGGDFNVCYVASREAVSTSVSISCLPEKKQ